MKKKFVFPVCLLCVGASAAVLPPSGPVELNWSRRPVMFSHQAHLNASALQRGEDICLLCHHPVGDTARHLSCATRDCHDNLNPRDTSVRSYYLAVHAVPKRRFYSCAACHTEQAGDDAVKMKYMAGCEKSACHR
jgi:hypothetical protein